MHRISKSLFAVLLFVALPSHLAQALDDDHHRLKEALALTDFQLSQCRQDLQYSAEKVNRILNESQRSKLRAVVNRLSRSESEWALASWLGLDKDVEWPVPWCDNRMSTHEDQLGFSSEQKERLWKLKRATWPEYMQRGHESLRQIWLRMLGEEAKTPPGSATPSQNLAMLLWESPPKNLPRDVAMDLLNDTQKATVGELETALELIREARSIGLLWPHTPNEGPLCN